ncbi:MAG TPA: hypothetical protein VD999_07035 [Vitreimonas sp.]|nr:hypothetical protein [Vitreimonas sp.]
MQQPSSAKELLTQVLIEISSNDPKWDVLQPSFSNALMDLVTKGRLNPQVSDLSIAEPSYVQEARAITEFCFFNGLIKKVFEGEVLDDVLMRKLMIESSHNLKDWLLIREFLKRDLRYFALINYLISQHDEFMFEDSEGKVDKVLKKLEAQINHFNEQIEKPSLQREANVMTLISFRNTTLEDIHDEVIALPANRENLIKLKQESAMKLAYLLNLKDKLGNSERYYVLIYICWYLYCQDWKE